MVKYRILVACGTGAATSTFVATRLKEELSLRGLRVETTQCRIQDIGLNLGDVDLIVTTSSINDTFSVPLFNGIPFLREFDNDALLDEIANTLKTNKH
ncbi:MAG TPA: hypothetical protein DDZ66_05200 [Firmicutes bacterium]|jgi:PTS system galactitol-specific IIB component|nr:hypothetical protein [Bacillota bacterium]